MRSMNTKLYEEHKTDFYAWIMHNLELLRQEKYAEIDMEHIREELEDMGGSIRGELSSRLVILLTHLLKWKYQPQRQGSSWERTLAEQRVRIARLLKKNPSLKYEIEEEVKEAYEDAIILAETETKIAREKFPQKCPFTLNQCLDLKFFPESEVILH